MDFNLEVIFNQAMEELRRGNRATEAHYPTSASIVKPDGTVVGKCLRQQFFKWNNIPPTDPISLISIQKMEWGNVIHDWAGIILDKRFAGIQIDKELSISKNIDELKKQIRGRMDYFVGKEVAIEVKSTFGSSFFNKDYGIIHVGPKEAHLLQVLVYTNLCDIGLTKLFYIARDTGFKLSFDVKIDKEGNYPVAYRRDPIKKINREWRYPLLTWENVVKRWVELEGYLARNEMPPMDCKFKSKYPCSYCDYKTACHGETKKRKSKKEVPK